MKAVAKKLMLAIGDVNGKIEKTGWNSYSKYKYITESDVNNAVLPALLKQGLLHTASIEEVREESSTAEQKNRFATVFITHTITDTESGEQIVLKSAGVAADTLDKSIYKAFTGACKYFWLKTFLISGDDADPENDSATKPTTAPAAAKPAPAGGFKMGGASAPAPAAKPAATTSAKGFPAPKAKPEPTPPAEQPTTTVPKSATSKWGFDKAGKPNPAKKEPEVVYDDSETTTETQDYEGQQDDPGFV